MWGASPRTYTKTKTACFDTVDAVKPEDWRKTDDLWCFINLKLSRQIWKKVTKKKRSLKAHFTDEGTSPRRGKLFLQQWTLNIHGGSVCAGADPEVLSSRGPLCPTSLKTAHYCGHPWIFICFDTFCSPLHLDITVIKVDKISNSPFRLSVCLSVSALHLSQVTKARFWFFPLKLLTQELVPFSITVLRDIFYCPVNSVAAPPC